jgi:formylmethanofuran dehydrogenase subunit A
MDKTFRNEKLAGINKHAVAASTLDSIAREYSLYEIAILTRAGPSRILGLHDRGHLAVGAAADIAVYRPHDNAETMFESPKLVFKDGTLVVRDGKVVQTVWGATHVAHCDFDPSIRKEVDKWFATWKGTRFDNFILTKDQLESDGRSRWVDHKLARRS